MKWLDSLKKWEEAPVGAFISLPPSEVGLQVSDKLAARILLFIEELWPEATDQERLSGLEAAIFWLTLSAGSIEALPTISPPKAAAQEAKLTPVVTLDLDSRTLKMLELAATEHLKTHFTAEDGQVRSLLAMTVAKAHRHYPDGRPDCETCMFFNRFKPEST